MIKYIHGDLLDTDAGFIVQQVNCRGVMGSGVAAQIKRKYPRVFEFYKKACDAFGSDLLDQYQFVRDEQTGVIILNLFAQDGYGRDPNIVYTRYDSFEKALTGAREVILDPYRHRVWGGQPPRNNRIAIPYKIGCGLGNGDWDGVILPMIERILSDFEVEIYILA